MKFGSQSAARPEKLISLPRGAREFGEARFIMTGMGKQGRIARERRTVRHMVEIYCRDHHPREEALCAECDGLFTYAMARLDRCVFGEDKPTCKKCPVHCYRKDMRAEMRTVMIYSGPRMLLSHPVLAIRHLLDERRDTPPHPAQQSTR